MKRICALLAVLALMLGACDDGTPAETDAVTTAETTVESAPVTDEITLPVPAVREADPADEAYVTWYGRNSVTEDAVYFDYTAAGFSVRFIGSRLEMTFTSVNSSNPHRRVYLSASVDGTPYAEAEVIALDEPEKTVVLEMEPGEHTVTVLRRSEARYSRSALTSLSVDGSFLEAPARPQRRIEFYGDSITCGYGNIASTAWEDFSTSTEDGMQTYAFLTAEALDAECTVLAKSGIPVNQTIYGKSETIRDLASRASYYDFADYLPLDKPDAVVIYGGVNDCSYLVGVGSSIEQKLRGDEFVGEYTALLTKLRQMYPDAVIVCCAGMYDETYYTEDLILAAMDAVKDEKILYCELPPGDPEDGIGAGHPTVASHKKAAAVLTEFLKTNLNW